MLKGIVEIEKLRLHASHGVLPQERVVGNTFEVSVVLEYDMEKAAENDDVAYALDYSRVVEVVSEVMAVPSSLLENVVLRMKERIIAAFPVVVGGKIKIAKLTPPIPVRLMSVSVAVVW